MNPTFLLWSDADLLARYAEAANGASARGDYDDALASLLALRERYGDCFSLGRRLEEAIAEMKAKAE